MILVVPGPPGKNAINMESLLGVFTLSRGRYNSSGHVVAWTKLQLNESNRDGDAEEEIDFDEIYIWEHKECLLWSSLFQDLALFHNF